MSIERLEKAIRDLIEENVRLFTNDAYQSQLLRMLARPRNAYLSAGIEMLLPNAVMMAPFLLAIELLSDSGAKVLMPFASSGAWIVMARKRAARLGVQLRASDEYSESPEWICNRTQKLSNCSATALAQRHPEPGNAILFANLPIDNTEQLAASALRAYTGNLVLCYQQYSDSTRCQPLGEPAFHRELESQWVPVHRQHLANYLPGELPVEFVIYQRRETPPALQQCTEAYVARKMLFGQWIVTHRAELRESIAKHSRRLGEQGTSGFLQSMETQMREWQDVHGYFTEQWHRKYSALDPGCDDLSPVMKQWMFAQQLRMIYGPVLPRQKDIDRMVAFIGERSVLHIDAGLGLWAKLLQSTGKHVVATSAFRLDAKVTPTYTTVLQCGDDAAALAFSEYGVLFLIHGIGPTVKPGYDAALCEFKGERLIFIGEYRHSFAQDSAFFAQLNAKWRLTEKWEHFWCDPVQYLRSAVHCFERV